MGKLVRTALLMLHVGGLALGLAIAGMATFSVVENLPRDLPEVAAHRVATAASLCAVAVGFALVLLWRGFTNLAPLIFALSFGVVGIVVDLNTLLMAKHFAPFEATTADYLFAAGKSVAAIVAALLAMIWTATRSRFPLF
jgi:hypothetical protein